MKRKFIIIIWKLITQTPKTIWLLILIGIVLSAAGFLYTGNKIYSFLFEKEPTYGGILKEGFYQDIETLNPFLANKISEKTLINLIYDSLVRPDGKGGYEYELAKNIIKTEKGLNYEIELKDFYWSNGQKITSDDVITTFDYIKKYNLSELEKIFKDIEFEKIDNYRLKVKLPIKDNYFIQKLSFVKIIPAKEWRKYEPSEWKNNEEKLIKISSGPFVFSKTSNLANGVKIYEFERNKFYYPPAYLDKVIIFVYPNLNKAYEGLKVKEINALGGLRPSYFYSVSSRNYKIYNLIFPRNIAIFFNAEKIKDISKVNQLKAAVNREEIKEKIFEGFAEPSYGIFSNSLLKVLNIKTNEIEKNKQPDNLDFSNITLVIPDNFYFEKIANYLQKKFKFNIKIEDLYNINNNIIPNKNYEAILYGTSFNLLPDVAFLFKKDSILNLANFSNLEIQKIIQELETGAEENFSLNLQNLSKIVDKEAPIVFLVNNYYPYIIPKNLGGFKSIYLNNPSEKFVKIEEWYLKERIKW